jgi:hypothetical protein
MKGLWILGMAAIVAVFVGVFVATGPGRPKSPEQPIGFSHKTHAGDSKIPCLYCHVNARRSISAGIPSVQRCISCHQNIPGDKPDIERLKEYWDRKEAIRWAKVTWMPDFVFFAHWPHIRADLKCQTCHGRVETMDEMEQVEALTMKFCVACHREQKASIDCATCHL